MQLTELISAIQATHDQTQRFAVQQVNSALTIRNWVIGFYIVEYEQNGSDRAAFGERLMKELAKRLKHVRGISEPQLYRFREFYQTYPQLFSTVLRKLQSIDPQAIGKFSDAFKSSKISSKIAEPELSFPPEMLLSRLSFSHFVELIRADTPLKRAFYEVQTIKNNWGVRELERAMGTLLFERTGLSTDKETVLAKAKDVRFRILKCHVLIDLKMGKFDHADAGQMNMYLNYFRKNEMTEYDSPPVGILLCADKNDSLVEYATADLPQEIFVSKYLIELPTVEELKRLVANSMNDLPKKRP